MSQDFLRALEGSLHFDTPQLAFCTHYSWFGVVKSDKLGLEQLQLFYNRRSTPLSSSFLTFSVDGPDGKQQRQKRRRDSPLFVEEKGAYGFSGKIAFAASDILCYHIELSPTSEASGIAASVNIPETVPQYRRMVSYDKATRTLRIETIVPQTDTRDPDPNHPLTILIIVPDAFEFRDLESYESDGALKFELYAPKDKLESSEQTFVVGIGEGPSAGEIESRAIRLGDIDSALTTGASQAWLAQALDCFSFDGVSEKYKKHYAKAAYQIICNTKASRGRIKGNAVYPNRGTYAAHYLWDACFTNLGASQFNIKLAEDYLLVLCENQEEDGKIPQFVCATWNRPDESQPPLIGWSAWRLYEKSGNLQFLRNIYGPVSRFVDWWFDNRDQDGDGVVEYQHALESGWDNSPRFDKGRIAAVDLNAYLNREMKILGKIAGLIGLTEESERWQQRTVEHARRIHERLFDREEGVYYDRLVADDRLWKVLTPASFSPLWAGVDIPESGAIEMIAKYLINPKHFFGAHPFPVVAYSDPHYNSDKWWRGPVWPNIAWTMTEVLREYGFEREYRESIKRLLDMMAQNDELNELYSSSTGAPLGAFGLCWTCAVFMDLVKRQHAEGL